MTLKDDFLAIYDHTSVAAFFGTSYEHLSWMIYRIDEPYRYHTFEIPKKRGGVRVIQSPSVKLKALQTKLKHVLYEIYPGRPSVHGFALNKSIVTNATAHLNKRYVFNLDLKNYFDSIHFGRIRNMFMSTPFGFDYSVSTILAQICCHQNVLSQGAPTSPILANIISWKLDAELQYLARQTNSTYTRYADDITFSFTCNKRRLPREIIKFENEEVVVGTALKQIIEKNGFEINESKIRLASSFARQEVTGLTVNNFVNVRRSYIRQISSLLHAWRKHGYELAENEFNNKYDKRHRASEKQKSLKYVLKGKLAFLKNVRTGRDPMFNKLASQFNDLVEPVDRFKLIELTTPQQNAIESLWVIETCYDDDNGEVMVSQGTGFSFEEYGVITCAHVVSHNNKILDNIEVFKCTSINVKYSLRVDKICFERDIAVCTLMLGEESVVLNKTSIARGSSNLQIQDEVNLLGFPAYSPGHSYFFVDSKIAKNYMQSSIRKFEISSQIREGNSGGPIINSNSNLIGVALEGAKKDSGNNGCLHISELMSFINSK